MKKIIYSLLLISVLYSNNAKSQSRNNATNAAIAGVGLVAAGISLAIKIEQLKESMELNATEYLLANHPEMYMFNLSVLDLDGVKITDLSNTSCITFGIQSFNPNSKQYDKFVLLMFVSSGWINDYGVNKAYVSYKLLNLKSWNRLFVNYCNLAIKNPILKIKNDSSITALKEIDERFYKENDTNYYRSTVGLGGTFRVIYYPIGNAKLTTFGIKYDYPTNEVIDEVAFYEMSNDSYLVKDYSDDYKIIYNENSLGLYLKELNRLVQIKRSTINEIHRYINY